jgi:hypothetical protein
MSGQSRVLTGTGRVMGASEATSVQLAMRRRHRNLNQIPAQERHLMLTFTVATSHNTVATSQNVCQRDDHAAEPACSAPLRCAHQQARRHSTGRASAGPSAVQSSHCGRLRIATCPAARGTATCLAHGRYSVCAEQKSFWNVVPEIVAASQPCFCSGHARWTNRPTAPLQRGTPNVVRHM